MLSKWEVKKYIYVYFHECQNPEPPSQNKSSFLFTFTLSFTLFHNLDIVLYKATTVNTTFSWILINNSTLFLCWFCEKCDLREIRMSDRIENYFWAKQLHRTGFVLPHSFLYTTTIKSIIWIFLSFSVFEFSFSQQLFDNNEEYSESETSEDILEIIKCSKEKFIKNFRNMSMI